MTAGRCLAANSVAPVDRPGRAVSSQGAATVMVAATPANLTRGAPLLRPPDVTAYLAPD